MKSERSMKREKVKKIETSLHSMQIPLRSHQRSSTNGRGWVISDSQRLSATGLRAKFLYPQLENAVNLGCDDGNTRIDVGFIAKVRGGRVRCWR
jgi:hypothetical protein